MSANRTVVSAYASAIRCSPCLSRVAIGGGDRVRQQLIRPRLRGPTPDVREPQQQKDEAERQDHVDDPADDSQGVRPRPEGVSRPAVRHRHRPEADEERDEPGNRLPRAKRQDGVGRHQERPHQPRARAGDPATHHMGQRHPDGAERDQRNHVSIEPPGPCQHPEVRDAECGKRHGQHEARRVTASLDRKGDRREDRQDARRHPDALPEAEIVIVGGVVRDAQQAQDHAEIS